MKKTLLILIGILFLMGCEKNNESEETGEINDNKQYYKDFSPDIQLLVNDSLKIDIDKNGSQDVIFKVTDSGHWVDGLNDSITISMGKFTGSGTGHLDTITHNEIIDNTQSWHIGYNLFTQNIKYIGVKKTVNDQIQFGWIKIDISDSTLILDSHYFRKETSTVVRAGIKDYH